LLRAAGYSKEVIVKILKVYTSNSEINIHFQL